MLQKVSYYVQTKLNEGTIYYYISTTPIHINANILNTTETKQKTQIQSSPNSKQYEIW